jgi:hypothetical protein
VQLVQSAHKAQLECREYKGYKEFKAFKAKLDLKAPQARPHIEEIPE